MNRKPMPMLDDYAALIAAGRLFVLVANEAVIGIVDLVPETEAMLLNNIAVRPDCKGQGFGRRLLEFAEAQARAAGYSALRLLTNIAMTENLALYGKIGFVETHRQDEGRWGVFMTKTLR